MGLGGSTALRWRMLEPVEGIDGRVANGDVGEVERMRLGEVVGMMLNGLGGDLIGKLEML